MKRILLALAALAPLACAAEDVRLWHSLDSAMALQLGRLAAEYNAARVGGISLRVGFGA